MTIDAKKLDEAITDARRILSSWHGASWHPTLTILVEAGEALAATLPREVERECWEVLEADGVSLGVFHRQDAAVAWADGLDAQIVRLTGKAILPRVKD